MSDIAEAAKLSRPSVYAVFANKVAVIEGLAAQHQAENEAQTAKRLKRLTSLEARLNCLFELWIIQPFASVIDYEYGHELMASAESEAPLAISRMYASFEAHVAELLRPHLGPKSSLSADELARILMLASKGLKASSNSLPELKRLCHGLIQMALAVVEGD